MAKLEELAISGLSLHSDSPQDGVSEMSSQSAPNSDPQPEKNIYMLPVELNASIISQAIGSSLHAYLMSPREENIGSEIQLRSDEWAKNSFFTLSSVSVSFRSIVGRTVKQLFDFDIQSVEWQQKIKEKISKIKNQMQLEIPPNEMEFKSFIKTPSNDPCAYVRLYDMLSDALKTRRLHRYPPYYFEGSNLQELRIKYSHAAVGALEYCRNLQPQEVYFNIHDYLLKEAKITDMSTAWMLVAETISMDLCMIDALKRECEDVLTEPQSERRKELLGGICQRMMECRPILNDRVGVVLGTERLAQRLLSPRMRWMALAVSHVDVPMTELAQSVVLGKEARFYANRLLESWDELRKKYEPLMRF